MNDYPTEARADYVFACMATNGQTRDMLGRCSCSIDVIATILPYDGYVAAETVLRMRLAPGERSAMFRGVADDDGDRRRPAPGAGRGGDRSASEPAFTVRIGLTPLRVRRPLSGPAPGRVGLYSALRVYASRQARDYHGNRKCMARFSDLAVAPTPAAIGRTRGRTPSRARTGQTLG